MMNTERLRCIVSGLTRHELTELEQRFVQSVEQYFEQEGRLTEQQESILEDLYREKTRWIFSFSNMMEDVPHFSIR